jgi:hypothetical protein
VFHFLSCFFFVRRASIEKFLHFVKRPRQAKDNDMVTGLDDSHTVDQHSVTVANESRQGHVV